MEKIAEILAISTFPLLIILVVTDIVAFNDRFYEKEFQKYDTYGKINVSKEVIDKQASDILSFIQNTAPLQTTLLNRKEEAHLQDVRRLVTKGHQLLIILVLVQLVLWLRLQAKKRVMVYGSLITLMLLGVLAIIPFERLFLQFHLLAFANDFWLLNPATDNLIRMYPAALFRDVVIRIGLGTTVIALWSMAVGLYKPKKAGQVWRKS